MSIASQALSWVSAGVLVIVAGASIRAAFRNREHPRVTLAWALGLLGVVSLAGKANALTGYGLWPVRYVSLIAFAASGYALLEHRAAILPLSRKARLLAVIATSAGAAATIAARLPGPPQRPSGSQLAVVYGFILIWCVCVIEPSVRFWITGRDRGPVERAMLRLLASGYIGIVLLFVVALGFGARLREHEAATLAIQACAFLLVVLLGASVAPPARLRRRWLRAASNRRARELVPAGVWHWERDGEHMSWSDELCTLFGHAPMHGQQMAHVFSDQIHPDDRPELERLGQGMLATGRPYSVDHRIVRADGCERWIQTRGEAVMDPATGDVVAAFGTCLDITERKLPELAVKQSEALLKGVVDHSPILITLKDPQGRLLLVNRSFEETVGVPRERAVGATIADLLPAVLADRIAENDRRALDTGEPVTSELECDMRNQSHTFLCIQFPLFDEDGRPYAVGSVASDITDRKLTELSMQHAYEREREAAGQLRALESLKDALLAAVSHELRTPLTVVLGLSAALQEDDVRRSALGAELVTRLFANAKRLERLLLDLLDLDRLKRGVLEPRRQEADIATLAASAVQALDLKRHSLTIDVPSMVVSVDPGHVERIIENLVSNAFKHTPPDAAVWLWAARTDGGILIAVDDAGPGVRDDMKAEIFEPFRQGEPPERAQGTGIGLSLVARFAEADGGRAWVEDRPGGGASFRVLLPQGGPEMSIDIAAVEVA